MFLFSPNCIVPFCFPECVPPDGLGGDAGGKLKKPGFTPWLVPNTGASYGSGFTALGHGYI